MTSLIGMSKEELTASLAGFGCPPWRARQLWRWMYVKGARHFDAMTDIAKPLRQQLAQQYVLARPRVTEKLNSEDGTRKWLIAFEDGSEVETVFIPESRRGTLCVSSQVGCTLNCPFCHTGTQSWVRNLTAAEIVAQLVIALDDLDGWNHIEPLDRRAITNIVFMGMGEPLFNYDGVSGALAILLDSDGFAFSKRRVTVSTAGVVPFIGSLGKDWGVRLAISLHAVGDELRNELVPINRKYNLAQLLDACRSYATVSNARRITFEYVMLNEINDKASDAHRLVALLRDIPAKINLIPFNPWRGSVYASSPMSRIGSFAGILNDGGLSAPIRMPRGQDIMAACGQLRSSSLRQRHAA